MSERIWRFEGQLQEKDKRVVTAAEGYITELNEDEKPQLDVSSEDGLLTIDLKLPREKEHGVGKQYLVNGSAVDLKGRKYGEVFNDTDGNTAVGIYSHAVGYKTNAGFAYQAAFGKYNNNDANNVFEVGYGESDAKRVNIMQLDKEGNLTVTGDVIGAGNISLQSLQEEKVDFNDLEDSLWKTQSKLLTYTNDKDLEVSADKAVQLTFLEFSTTSETNPLFWITFPFTLSADSKVTVRYYIDSVLQEDDIITETYIAGEHHMTLFNYFTFPKKYTGELKVTISAATATLSIPSFGIKSCLYVQGVGISGLWDGSLNLIDRFSTFGLAKTAVANFNEEVVLDIQVPIPGIATDTFGAIKMKKLTLGSFTDSVSTSFDV